MKAQAGRTAPSLGHRTAPGPPFPSHTVPTWKKSADWGGSVNNTESTLHQLSPYIGKTKSSFAASLVARFTSKGGLVYDPFSGCGTFALEAWIAGRRVLANDLSPYAKLLTTAKLFPYENVESALADLSRLRPLAKEGKKDIDLRSVPRWVREFFHPETLRETIAWARVLRSRRRPFLLSCLLGIVHHQRPGFLSFPSSHAVPYLRTARFPQKKFPELYDYRSVHDRLERKVRRAFRRVPTLDFSLSRKVFRRDAATLRPARKVDAILTSPPYMRQLDYGRDNRLRLWFLGVQDAGAMDSRISPRETAFLALMGDCINLWQKLLTPGGRCVLVIGNTCSRAGRGDDLPSGIMRMALEDGGFDIVSSFTDRIPNERRVRRGITGNTTETVLVLKRSTRTGRRTS